MKIVSELKGILKNVQLLWSFLPGEFRERDPDFSRKEVGFEDILTRALRRMAQKHLRRRRQNVFLFAGK